jgi:hypothetical protein
VWQNIHARVSLTAFALPEPKTERLCFVFFIPAKARKGEKAMQNVQNRIKISFVLFSFIVTLQK